MKTKKVLALLEAALNAAEMREGMCSFSNEEPDTLTPLIRQKTRSYREAWIIAPLRGAIEEITGKKTLFKVYWGGELTEQFPTWEEAETFIHLESQQMEFGDMTPEQIAKNWKIEEVSQ